MRGARNYPRHSLEEALAVPQKIADEMGGKPFKRLLLADALGIKPSSSNFRDLLSSSYRYGLTEGTEKASEIPLTLLGQSCTQVSDPPARIAALRKASLTPVVFQKFYTAYQDKKLPSDDMLAKILVSSYEVPEGYSRECARILVENGHFTGIIREIGGSPHVLLEVSPPVGEPRERSDSTGQAPPAPPAQPTVGAEEAQAQGAGKTPKPIFIGHGRNTEPLQTLEKILSSFQIPYKVTKEEANLGRPIPQKVKETLLQCGSAILIFTCDEEFRDKEGNPVWRPSENVVHELGAASFAFGDRVVIFKEKGLHFPANYQSIGYIEFEVGTLEAKTADLLKELIGFGLVRVTSV